MLGTMRLVSRSEAPTEETPPSTRPSSAASNSTSNSGPQRSTSMDSINTSSSEKPTGEELIPTRFVRPAPKVNVHANMQFVKTKPAALYKSAREQIQKTEAVKALRKTTVFEEEEWQSTTATTSVQISDENDWQSNLDKWKSSRRKRNEEVLERVIEVKKYEQETYNVARRKSKTFSEMQEEKSKRGRRYNLVVHDDDDNDLSGLGLSSSATKPVPEDSFEEPESKDIDNKDTKSDAGFCTGSDTGSDGVFPEDNISDTSSAMGDKKENSDSLLETTSTSSQVKEPRSLSPKPASSTTPEYTYDKAIEVYKQFADSAKKRSSSITSLSSNSSCTKGGSTKEETSSQASSSSTRTVINDKLSFFTGEMAREERIVPTSRSLSREKAPKVDINKRRSMFELRDIDASQSSPKPAIETKKLGSRVASFENVLEWNAKPQSKSPPKDVNFHEKLKSFNEKRDSTPSNAKTTPQRDTNFHKKLQNFSQLETSETKSTKAKEPLVATTSLKQRIASFEKKKSPERETREKSVSMECLTRIDSKSTTSSTNLVKLRAPSTPYMVVEFEETQTKNLSSEDKRKTVYEDIEKCQIKRETSSARIYSIFDDVQQKKTTQQEPEKRLQPPYSNEDETCFDSLTGSVHSDDHSAQNPISSINHALNDALLLNADIPPPHNFSNGDQLADSPPISFDQEEHGNEEFGDADIDEVIQNYELLSEATSAPPLTQENVYEKICDDEPTYENIYEKLNERNDTSNETESLNHDYQTLDDVKKEVEELTPPLPPKKMVNLEVLDVTWTEDDSSSSLAPPSMPPPPPPEEGVDLPMELPAENLSPDNIPKSMTSRPSSADVKKDIRLKRSSFLGSTPHEEELSLRPPPDIKEFLRQEREAERQILQSQNDRDSQSSADSGSRLRYTWDDRTRDDATGTLDTSDSSSNLEFQYKLAELELEMEQHDRNMLQRVQGTEHKEDPPVPASFQDPAPVSPPRAAAVSKPIAIQEFYTAPTYEVKIPNPLSDVKLSAKAPLPDPAKATHTSQPPPINYPKPSLSSQNGSHSSSVPGRPLTKPSIKTLSAIPKPKLTDNDSWIAKRKPDNGQRHYNNHWLYQEAEQRRIDSMGRQAPSSRSTSNLHSQAYQQTKSKHFNHTGSHVDMIHPPVTHSHSFINSHIVQASHPPLTHSYSETDIMRGNSNLYANIPGSYNTLNQVNNNLNARNHGRTYSPPKEQEVLPPKPLPEAIINTITQRVNNKFNNNDRPLVYASRNNNSDSHHDYMNTEELEEKRISGGQPIYGNSMVVNSSDSGINHATMPTSEEQRLLSVSGKKKCSHCCEELGRGAAMIIESLRLFYHIPCFKCCVCGIQLGNGSAGADVRVRNHKLHCHNCYSNDEGMKFSKV